MYVKFDKEGSLYQLCKFGIFDLGLAKDAVYEAELMGPPPATMPDGSPWQVGISDPKDPNKAIAKIPMMSGGLASSGDYQRCFTHKGVRYSHILSPKTGWPVKGLAAVSIWSEQCIIAGTVATIAMLMGVDGIAWLRELGTPFIAITSDKYEVITGDNNLAVQK